MSDAKCLLSTHCRHWCSRSRADTARTAKRPAWLPTRCWRAPWRRTGTTGLSMRVPSRLGHWKHSPRRRFGRPSACA